MNKWFNQLDCLWLIGFCVGFWFGVNFPNHISIWKLLIVFIVSAIPMAIISLNIMNRYK